MPGPAKRGRASYAVIVPATFYETLKKEVSIFPLVFAGSGRKARLRGLLGPFREKRTWTLRHRMNKMDGREVHLVFETCHEKEHNVGVELES